METNNTERLERIKSLYEEGKMDTEIAREIGISRSRVSQLRKYLKLPSLFTYSKISKIDNSKFEKLFNLGYSDYKIAKILGMSPDGIYSHRMRHGYFRDSLRENSLISIDPKDLPILIGTLMGDSSLRLSGKTASPKFSCSHSLKQKGLSEYLYNRFRYLGSTIVHNKRKTPDKRTGKLYEDYTIRLKANPAFKVLYDNLYKGKQRIISDYYLEHFNEESLAWLFMDDGCKSQSGYSISTMSFSLEDLEKFREFLYNKFGIRASIHSKGVLYIKACSKDLFKTIVSPYILECCKYKI